MAVDYDAPRRPALDEEAAAEGREILKNQRADTQTAAIDVDEVQEAESFELPGAVLSGEDLTFSSPVLHQQPDEIRCSRCFLIRHRSQIAEQRGAQTVCRDCTG